MKLNRIGIDLAKNVFQLHGVDDRGKVVLKKRLTRDKWLSVFCESVEPGRAVGDGGAVWRVSDAKAPLISSGK